MRGGNQCTSNRIYQLINGKRNMSANTAPRLAAYFGTSAQMWMNLQTNYDLWHEERMERRAIKNSSRSNAPPDLEPTAPLDLATCSSAFFLTRTRSPDSTSGLGTCSATS